MSLQSALSHHQNGDLEKAHELYCELLSSEPSNADVLYLLGILEAQRKNYEEALNLTECAFRLKPNEPFLHNSLGNILGKLGRADEACAQYEIALQLNPTSSVYHNNFANALILLNRIDDAVCHYREAIRLEPNYLDAHYNLGLLLARLGLNDEALHHFLFIVEKDPTYVEALHQAAQIFYQLNKHDKAIDFYQTILKHDPENIIANQNLGAILGERGDLSLAVSCLEKAHESDPHHIESIGNLGAIYLKKNDLNSALKYYLKLLNVAPGFDVYYNIGVIYMHQGRESDALAYFLEALALNPNDFATLNNLGVIYLKMEDYSKAALYYGMALKLRPDDKEIAYLVAGISGESDIASSISRAPKEYLQHLFDQYSPYFDKHLTQFLEYRVPDLLHDAVQKIIQDAKMERVLDLGCGTGLGGEKFRHLAKNLVGIDISENMLSFAKEKNIYDELRLADMVDALNDYDHNLDLIISLDSLVYCGDLAEVFERCSRALKSGGYLAFTGEITDVYPYVLQKTARFAHAKKYLHELINKFDFLVMYESSDVVLRKQKDKSVIGFLYVLKH